MSQCLNTVSSDGTCNKCSKKVYGNDLSCFKCKKRFHATGCSNDIDICHNTFLTMFKPFCEKTGVKYAARPGNFLFICDPCMTTSEIDMASNSDDKVDMLKTKVEKLESGLDEIKQLLLDGQNTVVSQPQIQQPMVMQPSSETPEVHIPWGGTNMHNVTFPMANVEHHVQKVYEDSSALILPAIADKEEEKLQMKTLNKLAVQHKISIAKSFKKKNGETVIVCDSRQTRNSLKTHVEGAVPGIAAKASDNCKFSVAVVGFDDDSWGASIVDTLVEQNYFLKAFFATENVEDHIKYVDTKPLRNNDELFQATLKVSKKLRLQLKKRGDRVIVGIISCKLFDRVFLKRCACCQEYGHFFAQCPNKDTPRCAKCSGEHETRHCQNPDEECCINCIRNGEEHTHHHAFSKSCPVYLKELEKYNKTLASSLN